jgi:hypothetical protein
VSKSGTIHSSQVGANKVHATRTSVGDPSRISAEGGPNVRGSQNSQKTYTAVQEVPQNIHSSGAVKVEEFKAE